MGARRMQRSWGGVVLLAALPLGACEGRAAGGAAPARSASAAATEGPPTALVYDRVAAGNQDVYVQPPGRALERRLTQEPSHEMLPRFARDGRSVVFASDRSGNWQIWESPADGGPARRVRTNAATEWQVDVSPDGQRLAFLSNLDGAEALTVSARDGSGARAIVRHGEGVVMGNPHWSPDGRRIAFSSNRRVGHQIYVVDADGANERRVSPVHRGGCEPRWSPDGRKLAWTDRAHLKSTSTIVEVDVETGAERVLVDWPALNYDVVYAPDGSEVAFASNLTGVYQIYRQRLTDGKSWQVTFGKEDARNPDYAPR